jgi:sugar phosphate isomerase/epimerase
MMMPADAAVRNRFAVSEFTTMPWSFEEDLEAYARLGIDAIEVCECKLDPRRDLEQLRAAARHGLEITSVQPRVHSLYPDIERTEPRDPSERMTMMRRSIDLFSAVAPGVPLVTISGRIDDGDFRGAFARAVREYRALADHAAERGVRIAFEPLNPIHMNTHGFICSLAEAVRLVDAVNRPAFGLLVDVYHVWQDAGAESLIRANARRIFGVHVNDWHAPRCLGDRACIGDGEIPLARLLRALDDGGYRGPYTLELFSAETLPDSLWKRDLSEVITENRRGFDSAWLAAHAGSGGDACA